LERARSRSGARVEEEVRMKVVASAVDYHTAGEPFRMVIGVQPIRGKTMLDKMAYAVRELDSLRRILVMEPRGHADMFGGFVTDPVAEGSLFGALFFDSTRFNTACGHGTIALATAAIELGMCEAREPETRIRLDVPAGQVNTVVHVREGSVESVRYRGVPSFVVATEVRVETSLGALEVDVAYGGVFHAWIDVTTDPLVALREENLDLLGLLYREIKADLDARLAPRHPTHPEIRDIDGVNFVRRDASNEAKQYTVAPLLADGAFDRSPCGTGTAAWLALLRHRGEVEVGESIVQRNLIGTKFRGAAVDETEVEGIRATVAEIEGSAFMTGLHQFVIDERDPMRGGFLLRRPARLVRAEEEAACPPKR
jgi:proline racemase